MPDIELVHCPCCRLSSNSLSLELIILFLVSVPLIYVLKQGEIKNLVFFVFPELSAWCVCACPTPIFQVLDFVPVSSMFSMWDTHCCSLYR